MSKEFVANVEADMKAPPDQVWEALVTPEIIKQYMFGATVTSSFHVGEPIVWKGEWKGKPYEDRGKILELEPERVLSYSHFSPLEGKPDKPENYHTVRIELSKRKGGTHVSLSQDKNPNDEAREHAEKNWRTMVDGLKKVVEHAPTQR